jgi:hypothetical protein
VDKNSISFAAAIVIGLSLVSVGVAAVVAPKFASNMFGVAAGDNSARVYVYATGMRDITIGCLLFALSAVRAGRRVLGLGMMILALIPIGDAIIVWLNAVDVNAAALALHISSAIVFFVLGFWLRLGVRSI